MLGMRGDASTPHVTNHLKPFFLYKQDSPEKRKREKEWLANVLGRGLHSNVNAESASDELMTRGLLEGGAQLGQRGAIAGQADIKGGRRYHVGIVGGDKGRDPGGVG